MDSVEFENEELAEEAQGVVADFGSLGALAPGSKKARYGNRSEGRSLRYGSLGGPAPPLLGRSQEEAVAVPGLGIRLAEEPAFGSPMRLIANKSNKPSVAHA